MKIIKIINEEFNCDDYEPITDKEEQFAYNLFDLIQGLVIDDNLNEVFTSENGLKKHFFQHCIADSIDSILMGDYKLLCNKTICTYEGHLDRNRPNRKNQTHEVIWNLEYRDKYNGVGYKYYPRGRVEVYNGKAYININSILNNPNIIDKIRREYGVEKLDYFIGLNDLAQGSHYDFELR